MPNPPKLPFDVFEFVQLEGIQFGSIGRTIEGIVISIDDTSVIIETQNDDLTENITIPTQSFYDGRWLVKKPTNYNPPASLNQVVPEPAPPSIYKQNYKISPSQTNMLDMEKMADLYNSVVADIHNLGDGVNSPHTPDFYEKSIKKCKKVISTLTQAISLARDPQFREMGKYDMFYYNRAQITFMLALYLYNTNQPNQQELNSIQEDINEIINLAPIAPFLKDYISAKKFFATKSKLATQGINLEIAPHLLNTAPKTQSKASLKFIKMPPNKQPSTPSEPSTTP